MGEARFFRIRPDRLSSGRGVAFNDSPHRGYRKSRATHTLLLSLSACYVILHMSETWPLFINKHRFVVFKNIAFVNIWTKERERDRLIQITAEWQTWFVRHTTHWNTRTFDQIPEGNRTLGWKDTEMGLCGMNSCGSGSPPAGSCDETSGSTKRRVFRGTPSHCLPLKDCASYSQLRWKGDRW